MSRPVAYNVPGSPINGSITNEDNVISYVVDGRGNDYFNNYESCNWVPSADGAAPIVFVTDTFTRGIEANPLLSVPLFFSCAGTSSAAILYTANRLPGSPGNYSNANDALVDLNKTLGYFILESNDPFQGINATDMALNLDASKMVSYPQTGVSWFDLSGNGINGVLTNGPTWNSDGYFNFDGTDDFVNFSNNTILNSNSITVSSTSNPALVPQNGFLFEKGFVNTQYALFFEGSNFKLRFIFNTIGQQDFQVNTSTYFIANRWYNAIVTYDSSVAKMYINGTNVLSTTYNATIQVNNNGERIGSFSSAGGTGYHFNGSIANTQVYPRALTEAQVKQNYFGAPIVTDGLVFAVDANNLVSYPKSGTAAYSLTGSLTGTLTNGVGFSNENGGNWVFDGTDDTISIQYNTAMDPTGGITLEAWIYPKDLTTIVFQEIFRKESGGGRQLFSFQNNGTIISFGTDTTGNGYDELDISITPSNYVNKWYHFVASYTSGYKAIYIDGQLIGLNTGVTGNLIQGNAVYFIGSASGGSEFFNGGFANFKMYSRGLTAPEVLQNYQVQQYRFQTPAGPVTNGLVLYLDAGNLDSYPGTGTTIYDLSGNGNHGELDNGVGFNQTNGGVLTFDGVDDYVEVAGPNLSSTNNTVMGAARYSGGVRGRIISGKNNNWLMGNWSNSTLNYYAEGWVSPVQNGPNDTNWRIYSALGDVSADSYSLYVNNSLSAGPNNGGSAGPNGFGIGYYAPGNSEFSTGEFSFLLAYNRVLTVAEMTQNYNFFKGRYGL